MSALVQFICLIYSFVFGIVFNLSNKLLIMITNKINLVIKLFIYIIYIVLISILYMYILFNINNGILHIYFILCLLLGYYINVKWCKFIKNR